MREDFKVYVPQQGTVAEPDKQPWVILLHPSLYCKRCKRRETFAPIWFTEVSQSLAAAQNIAVSGKRVVPPEDFQMFTLVYQCQRCLGAPEAFLIRRQGWTFSLDGRSPIEHIEVPKYIPEKKEHHYRDAVIAFNTGKTLAALFYLRTFVEQFARRVTGIGTAVKARGEEILGAYAETLPSDLRSQMPSMPTSTSGGRSR